VLSEDALVQDRQDLFIAHEITQMIPMVGHELYGDFRAANTWTNLHMPNAHKPFHVESDYRANGLWAAGKLVLEWLFSGPIGDSLEQWEYRRKLRRFAPEMGAPNSAAQLDASHVKGHFNDYGHPVLRKYQQRLTEYGIDAALLPAFGD
jgi:hypothetical protein